MEKEAFTEEQKVCGPLRTQNICVEMGISAQRFVTACQDREFLYAHRHVCKKYENRHILLYGIYIARHSCNKIKYKIQI